MNKKLGAIFIAVLMLIGMIPALSSIPPVQAQDECETYPMCVFLHPGAADTSKPGFSHTLDTLWGTQDGDSQSRQVFESYLDYAVLASESEDNPSSIGDLQFDIIVTETAITGLEIYVPPEFKFLAPSVAESVWTDMTNDYYMIYTATTKPYDPIAPGWTRIVVGTGYWGSGPLPSGQMGPAIIPGTYHVRLFNLAAPAVAGLYHFKIYYWDLPYLGRDNARNLLGIGLHSLGAGNFPVIIVKSELNPAWVQVTTRTMLMPGPPLGPYVSGQVVAEGTTPEGRAVKAQAFWGPNEFVRNVLTPDMYGNMGAEYSVILFGLAEGTYDLKVTCSGGVQLAVPRFTVLAGQSYHQYLTLVDSPDVFVTIYSKHGTGEFPWHNLWQLPFGTNNPAADPCDDGSYACPRRDIQIDLYDSDNNLVAFWLSDDRDYRLVANGDSSSFHKWFGWANRLDTFTPLVGSGLPWPVDANGNPVFGPSPLNPLERFYSVHLADNYDLLLQQRGYPSTRWDGHVPWDTADYVDGIANGAYTLEAFVTGYIMDQPDAYQRSFVVSGIDKSFQMDLRRSNWIETQMHLQSGVPLGGDTTVVLTAEDANGNERGAMAFYAPAGTTEWIDGPLCSSINSDGSYTGGCIIEGKNNAFLQGNWYTRGSGGSFELTEKDYGLNPTASQHSGGAVPLAGNPYTVKLYMADMGLPWERIPGTGWYSIVGGDPQVSIFLCASPQTLSFTIRPAWLDIFIRSVDFEVPAHRRPWTFPGSEVWIDFKDETGETVDTLDPTIYGLIQDAGTTMSTNIYNGWPAAGVDAAGFNGNGDFVGFGVSPYDWDDMNRPGRHSLLRVRYYGTDFNSAYCAGPGCNLDTYNIVRALYAGGARPTGLPAGAYTMDVHTHGYVMRRSFAVQVPTEGGADIAVDLIQGSAIRVVMSFKWENVKTPFTGFVRVEVLNENDELVGASVYGRAEPNIFTDNRHGGGYFPIGGDGYWDTFNFLYANNMKYGVDPTTWAYVGNPTYEGVNDVAGAAGFGFSGMVEEGEFTDAVWPSTSRGQRAMWSNLFYDVPPCPDQLNPGTCQVWGPWDTPGYDLAYGIDSNKYVGYGTTLLNGRTELGTDTVAVDVYGFYWYFGDPARTWAGGFPTTNGGSNAGPQVSGFTGLAWDSGIRGSEDIPNWSGSGGGTYHIKIWAFDYDHQRMYAQGWPLETTLPWGGAEDFYVDMNALATLRGTVSWLDAYGNYRALPWAQVSASPGPGDDTNAYGIPEYLMWLPAGTHDVSVATSEAPGVWGGPAEQNAQYTVVVSDGWVGGGDARLDHTEGVPVPELPALLVPFGLLAALAASVWLLRKRNLSTPLLMK